MDPEKFSGFFSFAFPSLIRNFGYRRTYFRSTKKIKNVLFCIVLAYS